MKVQTSQVESTITYHVFVEEDRLGKPYATGRSRVWKKTVYSIQDGQAFIQSLILEGYKIRYATITHRKIASED